MQFQRAGDLLFGHPHWKDRYPQRSAEARVGIERGLSFRLLRYYRSTTKGTLRPTTTRSMDRPTPMRKGAADIILIGLQLTLPSINPTFPPIAPTDVGKTSA